MSATTPATAPFRRDSIDDHLGSAARRFFGAGFRRVAYDVGAVTIDVATDGRTRLSTSVGVRYPQDWSRKATRDLRPHFSTVDAIVLGADLGVLAIADAIGLAPAAARSAHVSALRISAAGAPQEELEDLPTTVTARPGAPQQDGRALTRTDTRIGSMRVRCDVRHGPGSVRAGRRDHASPADVLGDPADRYHGTGFTGWQQHVRDVALDPGASTADATLSVTADRTGTVPAPRAAAPAGITAIDAFVAALQLGQVLLYDLDGVARADSETLWMRQTVLTADEPDPADAAGRPITTRLENTALVPMTGGLWRTADIVGVTAGVTLRCSVTHRLPRR